MARRRNGRDVSGWILVDKPAGPTSSAVVNKVRWAFDATKAGHAGTLDPAATGLLAVALGEATKTVPFVTDAMKTYDFTIRFGIATSTDDAEGETIASSDLRPSTADVAAALAGFTGDILQVPPHYSAVKVDGARAYALARVGARPDLAARPLHVERLDLRDRPDPDHVLLRMVCGKGGYVRSVARDLGAALGCHGHVTALRRLRAGPFDLDNAVALARIEALARSPGLDALLAPLEAGLADLPQLPCAAEAAARLRHGNPARVLAAAAEYGDRAWASFEGRAVAIGIYRAGELHPGRVFHESG